MKKWIWIWAAAALVGCGRHLERVGSVDIVPEPSDVRVGEGVFSLTRRTEIRLSDGDSALVRTAELFGGLAGKSLGRPLAVVRGGGQESGTICVALGDLPAEAYVLSVRSDRIDLTGGSPAGVFYGFQTLRQMLPESALRGEKARAIDLPVVEIRDEPRIGYRALLLDVGRHFFGPEEVKSVIDLMAMHKLNRLQWHLTEDQGWRIEIRKYPELTRRGAWRDRSDLRPAEDGRPEKDPQPYGGYYTRQQVREIVRYAADRFIEIVPEIEMPGHAMAALASYPWLGCLGEGYEVPSLWGVKEDVYCAGKDSTFVFLEDVLTEVTDLFPYELVHIGGDECPKARWKECPRCQRRMRDEGLGSEEELQSYFVRRIERFLASRNRQMVGWDEIRQGGLSETAIVLSRKREQGLRSALENGNDVIMTPYLNCYFDYYQGSRETEPLAFGGFLPLRTAYDLDPFEGLNAEQSRRILGVQCNLWTEFVATLDHAEYMLLPRLAAFAERAWTGGEGNYPDFLRRLESLSRLYDAQGYEYRDFRPEADSLRASLGS
ncbi:beta-N-acetylhexosaminidase [Alistipes ihumii]|mgnify:FL=1|jgi:N-acetyl-beta-hexosaminidase|uniref:beta-N-acetylhexosaminidase n=1 Tax=Alistipes ihumii TaxID=1470347 RepID=UPI003AB8E191|nr:beta-N-acetylhexosaminidase [Alistipes indistinctus]